MNNARPACFDPFYNCQKTTIQNRGLDAFLMQKRYQRVSAISFDEDHLYLLPCLFQP